MDRYDRYPRRILCRVGRLQTLRPRLLRFGRRSIIVQTEEPRPKYTTVATFLKILENKGFVGHTPEGKSHRYYPLVGREQYARGIMSSVLTSYFDGSLARMVSFFSRNEDISVKEMDEILEIMRNAKK